MAGQNEEVEVREGEEGIRCRKSCRVTVDQLCPVAAGENASHPMANSCGRAGSHIFRDVRLSTLRGACVAERRSRARVAEKRGAVRRLRNVGYGMRILNLEYPVSGPCTTRSTHHALQYR